MTAESRPPLFRAEAVEHHARSQHGGRVADVAHQRTAHASWALAAAVVVAVAAGCLVRADESAQGPIQTTGPGVVALVPAAAAQSGGLHSGLPATVRRAGATRRATVVDVGTPVAGAAGREVIPVTLAVDHPGTGPGHAVIRLRRRAIITLLVPSLRSVVGRG